MKPRVRLVQTCGACPEQYDAYIDGEETPSGYLRLRHGGFRADYNGETIFSGCPRGDGCFQDDERDRWLRKACEALLAQRDGEDDEAELYTLEVR